MTQRTFAESDDDHLRVCNCAGCGRELVSERTFEQFRDLCRGRGVIHDRYDGRPYCFYCITGGRVKPLPRTEG